MKTLYLKLIDTFTKDETIKELYTERNVDPVRHVDLYSGQDVNPEYFELTIYPALFVSFSIDHIQNIATLTFRLCYEQLRDTSSMSITTQESLKFFDFIDLTDTILQKMESERFGKLVPVSTEQQIEETVTDEFILTYQTSYTKNTDTKDSTGTFEDIEIKGGLYKNLL